MTISISTGLVIILTGVSLYWAVPALTRYNIEHLS